MYMYTLKVELCRVVEYDGIWWNMMAHFFVYTNPSDSPLYEAPTSAAHANGPARPALKTTRGTGAAFCGSPRALAGLAIWGGRCVDAAANRNSLGSLWCAWDHHHPRNLLTCFFTRSTKYIQVDIFISMLVWSNNVTLQRMCYNYLHFSDLKCSLVIGKPSKMTSGQVPDTAYIRHLGYAVLPSTSVHKLVLYTSAGDVLSLDIVWTLFRSMKNSAKAAIPCHAGFLCIPWLTDWSLRLVRNRFHCSMIGSV